jgi:hypothetical protein
MPSAACHSFFWATDSASDTPPAVGSATGGAYVPWQTSVITVMSLALAVRWSVSR